ncbi:dihydrodipicolinate synthase family protein [Paracoccus spongiarum]|uniref:Dihydrodipicolinate synthase family protein n=1 Tax=Paracoccus spongiarum TaxID=3064387 RepID=A0ABT9JF96_9RHOB|nr:dihydrodipicolinate synthase family protein [Paracoccus sp. 2205BS29-5]MDP5307757.1 dihydrodipicolinate synthase family protein [Paracoccus sp. 2205BS29-5]
MSLFHGVSAFPITPTDAEGRCDHHALRRVLEPVARARVDSIGLLGSTGGYAYLTPDQRREVLEVALDAIGGRVPVIAGIGALRSDDATALARHAASAGAAGLLLAPVSYTPLTEEEVFQHFAAVAAATGLPLCIYNNPSTTHFTFSQRLLERLAGLPTVAGVKMPLPADGDFTAEIGRLRAALPSDFAIGYSGDWGAAESLLAGADGFFSVAAGLLPDSFLRLARAAITGDAAGTARRDAAFGALWELFREFGSLRVMFMAAREAGLTDALPPRPILPLPEAQRDRVMAAMRAAEAA